MMMSNFNKMWCSNGYVLVHTCFMAVLWPFVLESYTPGQVSKRSTNEYIMQCTGQMSGNFLPSPDADCLPFLVKLVRVQCTIPRIFLIWCYMSGNRVRHAPRLWIWWALQYVLSNVASAGGTVCKLAATQFLKICVAIIVIRLYSF